MSDTNRPDGHDRQCPRANDSMVTEDRCLYCYHLRLARGEELEKFNNIWKANLPGIEQRNYDLGLADGRAGA
jgi:hypothetical protein